MATKTHVTKQEEAQTEVPVQIRASDPGSPGTGQFWYNTTSGLLKYFNGSTNVTVNAGGFSQYTRIVANPAVSGSTDTTVAAAFTGISNDQEMLITTGSYSETLSLGKRITIHGQGKGTIANGPFTFASGSSNSTVMNLMFNDNVTVAAGVKGLLVFGFILAGKTVTYADNNQNDNEVVLVNV